jgi:Putative viral replication protein/RNA helicase
LKTLSFSRFSRRGSAAKISKMANSPRLKYCFTLNNYTAEDEARIQQFCNEKAAYAIYGREIAPTTGTPHLQGYVHLKSKMRFNAFKAAIGQTAHIEPAKGSDQQNFEYCSKSEDFFEVGEKTTQGKRTDLSEAVDTLKETGCLKRLAEEHPEAYIRYHRGFESWKARVMPTVPRNSKTRVHVFVGPPGTGKSRAATDAAEGSVFRKHKGEWWDGYEADDTVIIDDFYGWIAHCELLRICDRYPHKVPIKGAFREFVAKDIFITSNKPISEWYDFERLKLTPAALYRRITNYKWVTVNENGDTIFQDFIDTDTGEKIRINY